MAKKIPNKSSKLTKPITKSVTNEKDRVTEMVKHYYVGKHAFTDVYWETNSAPLVDPNVIMGGLKKVIKHVGATILHKHISPFDGGGYTGIYVLSENHASVHTWPEYGMATIDIYMCGDCDAFMAVDLLMELFVKSGHKPHHHVQSKYGRGYTYPNTIKMIG